MAQRGFGTGNKNAHANEFLHSIKVSVCNNYWLRVAYVAVIIGIGNSGKRIKGGSLSIKRGDYRIEILLMVATGCYTPVG